MIVRGKYKKKRNLSILFLKAEIFITLAFGCFVLTISFMVYVAYMSFQYNNNLLKNLIFFIVR